MKPLGLYIHVPFCLRKCAYCDFYSGTSTPKEREAYVAALAEHIKGECKSLTEHTVDTVFFGGGTPSLLTPEQFHRAISSIAKNVKLADDAEISFEANPATLSYKSLCEYRSAGANRISIGLQSASDTELKLLGRIHTVSDFEATFSDCRRAGFDNINVDLMYGIPAQTAESFAKTLDFVTNCAPEHISAYSLILEPGTPLYERASELSIPDGDEAADLYDLLCAHLSKAGYEHYEISNFAKNGYRCRHNVKYWQREEYLGFGPSAHSFFGGCRFYYPADRAIYLSPLTRRRVIEDEGGELTDAEEAIMLAMRLSDGVDVAKLKEDFSLDFEAKYQEKIQPYIKSGHIRVTPQGYAFTDRGMFVSNYILAEIL